MIGCRPLSDPEYNRVLASFAGRYRLRDRLLFALGVASGFRVSELLSLVVSDLYRMGKPSSYIKVRRRHCKGQDSSRSVALAPGVWPYLEAWIRDLETFTVLGQQTPVFLSRRKGCGAGDGAAALVLAPISRVQAYRILAAAFRVAGLDLNCFGTHVMRKTFAARVYSALGENPVKLQKALGHRWISSTVAYISFDEAEIDRAVRGVFAA